MNVHAYHRRAFSLIELSIVLVILGLLVGGILAGQSLIRAAELRSVTSDLQKHHTALYSFRDKYFGLPGDITNATAFWGDQATGTGACASALTADGTPGTCNGDGDGKILWASSGETTRAWQQLAMAGLVEGSYSGTGVPSVLGTNVPRGRVSNTGFGVYWSEWHGTNSSNNADPNRFIFGAPNGSTLSTAALVPEEGWNIDTKLDDGKPLLGKMRSNTGGSASGVCYSGADYALSNSGIACYFTYVAY